MKFIVNNREYDVIWRYQDFVGKYDKNKNKPLLRRSICEISTIALGTNATGKERYIPRSIGIVSQHRNDVFNKVRGRFLSFKKAIRKFNKEDRADFWSTYLMNCRVK